MNLRFFLLPFLFVYYLFSFEEFYNFKKSSFEYYEDSNSYKLTLKNQRYLDYKLNNQGYKFFIPYFTKEFNLKILRFNSVGYIDMLLSLNPNFTNRLDISPTDIKYYITNYRGYGRQLDYLLRRYTIPYHNVTSISIEAYNIPYSVSKKLNRYFYFKIIPHSDDKLQYILYSFYIVFDKNRVDNYIRIHRLGNFENFVKSIYRLSLYTPPPPPKIVIKEIKKEKIVKKEKKVQTKKRVKKVVVVKKRRIPTYSLHMKRFLFMKEFGYQNIKPDFNATITNLDTFKNYFEEQLEDLKELDDFLKNSLNRKLILNGNEIYQNFNSQFQLILDNFKLLPFNDIAVKTSMNECYFDKNNINKQCFKNSDYFQNYVYFSLKNNKLIQDGELKAFADYKSFNDIAKYYFEIGDFNRSEKYLLKAYYLADKSNKKLIAHNLGVLYATSYTDLTDYKKAINYFKESREEIDFYNIGVLYYMGKGVKESDKKAREYFSKAPHIPYAIDNLKIMKKYRIGEK